MNENRGICACFWPTGVLRTSRQLSAIGSALGLVSFAALESTPIIRPVLAETHRTTEYVIRSVVSPLIAFRWAFLLGPNLRLHLCCLTDPTFQPWKHPFLYWRVADGLLSTPRPSTHFLTCILHLALRCS